ncbi:phytoene dehydrogenase [Elizabethkingia meningoseptica]|uniref:phytoene desaturase family protein n=1 Tax=Elizabethkingia meningoseptica TaxID=238 RepID=UPI000332D213|nr:phytoene desaturase family protein [Elizabethkingia meningoseptica]AQX05273.1 phytoene dehydrogenase [Elizabethkingia meningoseptica]AQX47316.1 phytoene dehydrogenase [Elizabethkingia meningoseptica]EOR31103.1 phytoene desaturase [Elizabethkingia meningoseptica ATCC 13253 = NBRC 12535]KUY24420.1 phytoene dehydrogenase [Elizabethkingia meningoseptica]OPB76375.1 phytoene dehydrogenase [Elizabethkingia meningoseptica]
MEKKKIAIIGSGFSGISAAAYAAKSGHDVHVFEKHDQPGGRARQFRTENGYVFDMGPSWYWMHDIIEGFFNDFGCSSVDFFNLVSLDPQFEIIFSDEKMAVPEKYEDIRKLFENTENGASLQYDKFMQSAKFKYEVGMQEFVNKPCYNWGEFLSLKIAKSAVKLDLLSNFRNYVSKYFSNPKLKILMEFPVIFLGASPKNIPALYSLMNYGGYALGTKYPMGGFYQLVLAMQQVAEKQGATFHFNKNVQKLNIEKGSITSLTIDDENYEFDAVIASSDYHHTETLLPSEFRNYPEKYWKSRTFAPSCLIYYLGVKEKIPNLKHHTLFFENDLDEHIDCIYGNQKWPEKPLFYCCCPSKTDPGVAPENCENLFLLMPLATGINDQESIREQYLEKMLLRIEKHTGAKDLISKLEYKRSYCVSDFISDYNAYGGNAYGLANTLSQTAVLKPKIRNNKLENLFYTGQLTVPGPGVPPSVISGRIVAKELDHLKNKRYEKIV